MKLKLRRSAGLILISLSVWGCSRPQPVPVAFTSPPPPPSHIAKLVEGNQRFAGGTGIHPAQDSARRAELVKGQHPSTIVVSCSDSRVPPEIVFDAGLGEIFTVRTAGEVVDAAALASIEYAVEHLGAAAIVVMGHESCGAVKAALSTPKGKSAGSPSLDKLVAAIRPNIAGAAGDAEDKTLLTPVKANARGIAAQLVHDSEIIHEAVRHHKVKIESAVYHLDSGKVEFLRP